MFDDAPIVITPAQDCWTTIPVPRGTEFRGVLAGRIRTVEMHHDGTASKPCRMAITKGAVPCWCQREATPVRTYGYAPFCCRDGQQVVVMIAKTTALKMRAFKHGQPLKLVRPDREKAALVPHMILPEEMGSDFVKRITAGPGACIAWYLLATLWHDDVLVKHFYGGSKSAKAVPLKAPPPRKPKDTDTPAPKKSDTAVSLGGWLDGIGREVPK